MNKDNKKRSFGERVLSGILVRVVVYAVVGPILGEIAAQTVEVLQSTAELPYD